MLVRPCCDVDDASAVAAISTLLQAPGSLLRTLELSSVRLCGLDEKPKGGHLGDYFGDYSATAVGMLCEALRSTNCVVETLKLGRSGMREEEAYALAAALGAWNERTIYRSTDTYKVHLYI